MTIRLSLLQHVKRTVEWSPVPGVTVVWILGCWVDSDQAGTAGQVIDSVTSNPRNLDASQIETINILQAALQKFVKSLRAVTLNDHSREFYLEVIHEETTDG